MMILLQSEGIVIFPTAVTPVAFGSGRVAVGGMFAYAVARAIAPLTFMNPAPWVKGLTPVWKCAVYWRIALIRLGVRLGFASSISATAPVTDGVAMLVPLRLSYGATLLGSVGSPPTSHGVGVARAPRL